ncbi:RagB/SusD family nutrient uptake outer membrane protein [Chitinophaga sp. GbtcB8]|uniref:RagB/SusD family nutrient uptake outer membrane protein n=1 Tax=Chitinophaga sp. GbtcB8 TaxID=2824753 RepID=UPI001C311022|nr:RagB/SusD family nutrient uptake outer membrane protein [Chitinophaga sp. GbtcB8]
MQTSKYILPFLASVLLLSCKKFLDVQPQDAISDDNSAAITDKSSAETATRGLYRALSADAYYGSNFVSIGYLSGDNIVWTGSQSIIQQFISHNVRADNANIASAWSGIYATINRANHIIAKVPAVTDPLLTQQLKNQFTGEAYFVRALGYFDLARTWGGVQITLTPTITPSDKYGIKRSSLDQTYNQVLSDLVAADSLLPATTNRFRATQKTAWALRARYHLYRQQWADAETYATKVIADSANYKLVQPYSAFFANNATATSESVLELSYSATYTNSHRNSWQPPANGGTRQWAPNDAFLALVNDPAIGGNRSALVAKTSAGLWYGNLYYRSPATDPAFVIRIAELWLIRAEARAQLNNLTGAVSDLNAVHSRAGVPPSEAASKSDLLLAIENERRLEFAFEGHRWYDLVRTNRAAAVLGVTDVNKQVLPIPAGEVLNDIDLEQNKGY